MAGQIAGCDYFCAVLLPVRSMLCVSIDWLRLGVSVFKVDGWRATGAAREGAHSRNSRTRTYLRGHAVAVVQGSLGV